MKLKVLALTALVALGAAACEQTTHVEVRNTSVSVSPGSLSLIFGNCQAAGPSSGSLSANATVTWRSSDTTIVKVSPTTGTSTTVTAVGVGTATVTATPSGDMRAATVTVTVTGCPNQPGGTVSLQASRTLIVQGEASDLSWAAANVTSCSASAVPATSEWSGSKAFTGTQQVHPTVTTTYTFTCVGLDGLTYSASVTIQVSVPGGVTINPPSLNLYPAGCTTAGPSTGTLTANMSVNWESLNPSIVSVNPTTGSSTTITAHAQGSAIIRATGPNGQTATATVTVSACPSGPSVVSVSVSPRSLTLYPSSCPSSGPSTGQLTATVTVTGGASQAVTWTSSNNSVATVSSSGLVTVVGTGTTTITVRSSVDPTKFDQATITVNSCPAALVLLFSGSPTTITRGQSATLSWSTQNATSCSASDGWSGSKAVSGSQSVSPTVTTTYTLTCAGQGTSVTRSVTITVNEPATVVSVTIQPDTARCSVGGQLNFGANVTVTGNASTGVTWSVSNASIASIYQTSGNQVTLNCHQVGQVTVTARSVHDTSKFDTAIGIVIAGTMNCTWSPASGLQANGDVITSRTTVSASGTCTNEHGQSFLPYWYSSAPSRVGVQASQQVVIDGTTYYAGNNATITGVATGEAMVCIQAAISQTSPAFCRKVIVQ
jgi:uncharacterized protein YjdB